jgi:CHAD domain-containing protein
MPFHIKTAEHPAKGITRIARAHLKKALADAHSRRARSQDEVVHAVRKRMKRLRAAWRLIRAELDADVFRAENKRFRDIGRSLAALRDARICVRATDELRRDFRRKSGSGELVQVRDVLAGEFASIAAAARERDWRRQLAASLEDARRAVDRWELEKIEWAHLRHGLRKTYKKGRRARDKARREPTDENLHEWRKRVKDLWYQLDLLRALSPKAVARFLRKTEKLSDQLGEDHDLAVLRTALTAKRAELANTGGFELALELIARRRPQLRKAAFRLGDKLFSEKPRAFVQRLGGSS